MAGGGKGGASPNLAALMAAAMNAGKPAATPKATPKAKVAPVPQTNLQSVFGAAMSAHPASVAPLLTPQPKPPVGAPATPGASKFYSVPPSALNNQKALQYIASTNKLNAEASFLDKKPLKEQHKSVWSRVSDILSRGMYGTASATLAGEDAAAKNDYQKHGNYLSQVVHGFEAMPGGFMKGIEGKNKASWSDALQRSADNKLAHGERADPSTMHGKGHVGGLMKYGVGTGLDMVLDPTNLVGVGAVRMAARGALSFKDTVAAAAKYGVIGKRTEDALHGLTDPALQEHAHQVLAQELEHVQGMHAYTKSVGVSDKTYKELHGEGNGMAWANSHHAKDPAVQRTIKLSPEWNNPSDVKHFVDNHIADPKYKSVPNNNAQELMRSTIIHEMGHHIDFAMKGTDPLRRDAMMQNLMDHVHSQIGEHGTHSGNIMEHDIIGGHHRAPDVPGSGAETPFWQHIYHNLSKYGASNHAELLAEAWAQHRIMGDAAGPIAKIVGGHMEDFVKNLPTDVAHTPEEIVRGLGHNIQGVKATKNGKILGDRTALLNEVQRANTMKQGTAMIEKVAAHHAEQAVQEAEHIHGNLSEDEYAYIYQSKKASVAHELTKILDRNVNPKTQRGLQLKIAGMKLPGVTLPEKASDTLATLRSTSGLGKGMDKFGEVFKSASARLLPAVHQMNVAEHGAAANILHWTGRHFNEVFKASVKDRQRAWHQAEHGITHDPIAGGLDHSSGTPVPVDNMANHFSGVIDHVQKVMAEHGLTFHDINPFLPKGNGVNKDFTLTQKGHLLPDKTLDPKWMHKEIYRKWAPELGSDPGKASYLLHAAVQKAITAHAVQAGIADHFGIKAGTTTATALKAQGYRTPQRLTHGNLNALPFHKNLIYHPDVADSIEKLHDMHQQTKGSNDFLKVVDGSNKVFKSIVTKYMPGFHSRNLQGEVFNSFMAGVHDPRVYYKAAKVLGGRDARFYGPGIHNEKLSRLTSRIANNRLQDPIKAIKSIEAPHSAIFSNTTKGGGKRFIDVDGHVISGDLIRHLFNKNGIDTGFIASTFRNTADPVRGGLLGKVAHTVDQGANTTAQSVEVFARMAHFIHALENSKLTNIEEAAKVAAQEVRKYHFDYNDFSHAEKAVFSRIIPFYKWTRKNIPLMTEMLHTKPGKAIMPYKALNEFSKSQGFQQGPHDSIPNGDSIEPQYLKDSNAVPVGHHGKNTVYENAAIPFSQAFQFFGGGTQHGLKGVLGDAANNAGQMLGPGIKMPLELLTHNRIGGAPITDKKKYFMSSTPYTNVGQRLSTNATDPANAGQQIGQGGKMTLSKLLSDPAILQLFSGVGTVENTPKNIQATAKQMQTDAVARRKAILKKKGFKGNVKP